MTPEFVAQIVEAQRLGIIFGAMVGVGSGVITANFIDLMQMIWWRARARARRKCLASIRSRRMLQDVQQAVLRG